MIDYARFYEPWFIGNQLACRATHSDKPNYDQSSRGRLMHLQKEGNKTMCNMLVAETLTRGDTANGLCKVCFPDGIDPTL